MTYQNNTSANAIRQIQEFLRLIEIFNGGAVTVPADGIYGKATAKAVREFQKINNLPITGTVDKKTYDSLYEKALEAEFEMSEPLPIYIFQNGTSVKKGEKSDFVMFLQALLNELTIAYDDYETLVTDGVFGEATEAAIKAFQEKNMLQNTGVVDKRTWNAMVENYNKHALYIP